MQLNKLSIVIVLSLLGFTATAQSEEKVPQAVYDLAETLKDWGNNSVLVTAVKEQNAKGSSLDEIKSKDEAWMKTVGVDSFMDSLMNNAAATELKKLESSQPYFLEVFLMDQQGANVAMTNKTSDYWQGDEAKFTKSYNGGAGGLDIGKVKFDKSSQAYLVQVSVPVMDGTTAIGAITIGINLDELEK